MVIGFDKFIDKFQGFADNYVVIGGCACDWLFSHRDARFRATKDIDLVICTEEMTASFASAAIRKDPVDPRSLGLSDTVEEALSKLTEMFKLDISG